MKGSFVILIASCILGIVYSLPKSEPKVETVDSFDNDQNEKSDLAQLNLEDDEGSDLKKVKRSPYHHHHHGHGNNIGHFLGHLVGAYGNGHHHHRRWNNNYGWNGWNGNYGWNGWNGNNGWGHHHHHHHHGHHHHHK